MSQTEYPFPAIGSTQLPALAAKYTLHPDKYVDPQERSAAILAYLAIEPEIPLRTDFDQVRTFLWNVSSLSNNITAMVFNILRDNSAARLNFTLWEPKPAILTVAAAFALAVTHYSGSGDFPGPPWRSRLWAEQICYKAFTTQQLRDCKEEILVAIDHRLAGHASPYNVACALNCLNLSGGQNDNPLPCSSSMDARDRAYDMAVTNNRRRATRWIYVGVCTARVTYSFNTAVWQHRQPTPCPSPGLAPMLNQAVRLRDYAARQHQRWEMTVKWLCQPVQQEHERQRLAGYRTTKARYVAAEAWWDAEKQATKYDVVCQESMAWVYEIRGFLVWYDSCDPPPTHEQAIERAGRDLVNDTLWYHRMGVLLVELQEWLAQRERTLDDLSQSQWADSYDRLMRYARWQQDMAKYEEKLAAREELESGVEEPERRGQEGQVAREIASRNECQTMEQNGREEVAAAAEVDLRAQDTPIPGGNGDEGYGSNEVESGESKVMIEACGSTRRPNRSWQEVRSLRDKQRDNRRQQRKFRPNAQDRRRRWA